MKRSYWCRQVNCALIRCCKKIMLPLSPVTCHHLYLNSEPRRKAWAETVDRIRHGHQVTSSEYWTDTGDNQTSEKGQKTRAESLKHPDMGPSSWPGDTEMGFGVRMTSVRLSILNILFSPPCPLVCVVCPSLELLYFILYTLDFLKRCILPR